MKIYLKSEEEIGLIREGGAILSQVLAKVAAAVVPGVSTGELDELAEKLMREAGGEPAFKGYRTHGAPRAFPSTICASVNDEVVHAPARYDRKLNSGDLFKIDLGLRYKEYYTDMAATVPVGRISPEAYRLIDVTREALWAGVEKVRPGGWVSEVGKTVDKLVRRQGFTAVRDLVGHGVGKYVHEEPPIPNYFDRRAAPVMFEPGMVLAIEPMINAGDFEVDTLDDGWTVVTLDGSLSAHFEVTVAVLDDGIEIMTPMPEGL